MSHPALRRGGALLALFVAFMAWPTTMVGAESTTSRSPELTASRPAQTAARARRHRAVRRPPGGVVWARNAILLDPNTDSVLFEKNADDPAPIASLTKLMTAMVFLEQNPDLRRTAQVERDDLRGAGHTQLRNREVVPLYDLLHMSLMNSDNAATRVLVRESGLELDAFVDRMNRKARELGLANTRYYEVTGLDQRNVGSAADIAKLLQTAADNTLIRDITTTDLYRFRTARRQHQIVNTNRLLKSRSVEVNCGKTGFIVEAGYCIATWVRARGKDMIAVVLGAPTNATRFADVKRLIQHVEAPTAGT